VITHRKYRLFSFISPLQETSFFDPSNRCRIIKQSATYVCTLREKKKENRLPLVSTGTLKASKTHWLF